MSYSGKTLMDTEELKEEVLEWLNLCDQQGMFSSIFIQQLADGVYTRTLHVHSVYDAIKKIANNTPYKIGHTKKETVFKAPPLKGLWHKHYFQASYMAKNMQLEMSKGDNFDQAFKRAMKASGQEYNEIMSDSFFNQLAHEMTIGLYEKRSGESNLTGEWIVYLPINGKNYYLTLGTHDNQSAVYSNVVSCFGEFPVIQEYLDNVN